MAAHPDETFGHAIRRAAPYLVALAILTLAILFAFAKPAPRGGSCPLSARITGEAGCDDSRPFLSPFRGFVLITGGLMALRLVVHTLRVRHDPSRSLWSTEP